MWEERGLPRRVSDGRAWAIFPPSASGGRPEVTIGWKLWSVCLSIPVDQAAGGIQWYFVGAFFYWSPPAFTRKPWDTPNGFPKLFLRETKDDLWLPGPSSGCSKDCSIPPWDPTARPWLVERLARGWPGGGSCLHTSAGMTIGWSKASPNGHPFRGGLTLP